MENFSVSFISQGVSSKRKKGPEKIASFAQQQGFQEVCNEI
jgi:hypothetical protein